MNFFKDHPDLFTLIVAGSFLLSSFASMFYYLYFFRLTARKKKKRIRNDHLPPCSIIICAKNEGDNLQRNLPSILEQHYPDFEVIVVDDCSEDDTQDVLLLLKNKYPNLKYTTIKKDEKFTHSKKLALTIGIKAAKNEHLLLTDADCKPVSNLWIRNIASNYRKNIEIIIAYGAYETTQGILNKLIRYEAVFTAMQYMGFAERGLPFMGVGRNLSYRKSLFFRNKGFASHISLISGDDDLFISETANITNTAIETNTESFTISIPKDTFKNWYRQRKRHFTTGNRYKLKIRILLGTEYFLRIVIILSFIYLLAVNFALPVVLSVFIITLIVKGIIYKIVLQRLNEKFLFLFSLIIESFIPYIYIFIVFSNLFEKKHNRWI